MSLYTPARRVGYGDVPRIGVDSGDPSGDNKIILLCWGVFVLLVGAESYFGRSLISVSSVPLVESSLCSESSL
jgi:hypothetical protein